jgi:hypothetical protein
MSEINSTGQAATASSTKTLTETKRLLASVTSIIQRYLSKCINQTFDSLDDSLFELANSARTNNEQSCFFDAMREIRIKRRSIEEYANSAIPLFITEPRRVDIILQKQKEISSELTLLGEQELEELVLMESAASRVRVDYSGDLLLSQQRLYNLYESSGMVTERQSTTTALDPQVICRIISQSCSCLEVEAKEKLLVLRHIGYQLQESYGLLLHAVNEHLADNGILPSLKFKSATDATAATMHQSTSAEATTANTEQSNTQHSADTYAELQSLLAKMRRTGNEPEKQANDETFNEPAYVVSEKELLQVLADVQRHHIPENLADGRAELIDLKEIFSTALNGDNSSAKKKVVNQENDDAINLVSMLFEFILDDYNLSAPIQVLISRLQIPILKVVIKDPSFFSRSTHPARRLLNALAKAGIGWNDASEKSKDKLYDQIHNIVRKILDEFDGDISLFTRLNDDFQRFLDREGRRASIIEERTKEAEIGRIKTQKAQNTVKSTLKGLTGNQAVPEVAREILENGWSRVMFLSYLKNDKENRWLEAVKVAEELIWCLSPPVSSADRERWTRVAPGCIKALKKGLQEVSYNSAGLDDTLSQLKAVLAQIFKHPLASQAATAKPANTVTPITEPGETAHTEQPLHAENSAELIAISSMQTGDWIEFSLVNGSRFRCKLSAKIDDPDCYIFVNRLGLKVVEKSRMELANDLAMGRLSVLEQGLLVDRALDAVMGNLRKITAKQA